MLLATLFPSFCFPDTSCPHFLQSFWHLPWSCASPSFSTQTLMLELLIALTPPPSVLVSSFDCMDTCKPGKCLPPVCTSLHSRHVHALVNIRIAYHFQPTVIGGWTEIRNLYYLQNTGYWVWGMETNGFRGFC